MEEQYAAGPTCTVQRNAPGAIDEVGGAEDGEGQRHSSHESRRDGGSKPLGGSLRSLQDG